MIDLSKLTPPAKTAVEAAVGREIWTAPTDKEVPQWFGFTRLVPETVSRVASDCYDLTITTERRGIQFDPIAVVDYCGVDDIELLESYVGERVYPLAVLSWAYGFLTDSGRVIILDHDWLFYHVFRDVYALLNWLFAEDATYVDERRELSPSERPDGFA